MSNGGDKDDAPSGLEALAAPTTEIPIPGPDEADAMTPKGPGLDSPVVSSAPAPAGKARPSRPPDALERAFALQRGGRIDEAIQAYAALLQADPGDARAWLNLGVALRASGRLDAAAACYRRTIAIEPKNPGAHSNLGNVLRLLGRHQEATQCQHRALELDPNYHAAAYNMGLVLHDVRMWREAVRYHDRALAGGYDRPEVHMDRAVALLAAGDYKQGFAEYETRLRAPGAPPRPSPAPVWDGGPIDGKTILVQLEAGARDTLMFLRYLPALAARGARVVVLAPAPMAGVVQTIRGVDRVHVPDPATPLPAADLQVALNSLPHLFGTTLDSVPTDTPYLGVPPGREPRQWVRPMAGGALKVGIVWADRTTDSQRENRTCPFTQFLRLAAAPGVALYRLQAGPAAADRDRASAMALVHDIAGEFTDLSDAAEAVMQFDLVVGVDSSIMLLAGALGRPGFVVLPTAADWRWTDAEDATPWLPTMRLFRQRRPGDWDEVFVRVAEALGAYAAAQPPRPAEPEAAPSPFPATVPLPAPPPAAQPRVAAPMALAASPVPITVVRPPMTRRAPTPATQPAAAPVAPPPSPAPEAVAVAEGPATKPTRASRLRTRKAAKTADVAAAAPPAPRMPAPAQPSPTAVTPAPRNPMPPAGPPPSSPEGPSTAALTPPPTAIEGSLRVASAILTDEGAPRFHAAPAVARIDRPGVRLAIDAEAERGGYAFGVRRFLDEHLQPGDVMVDVGIGIGLFALTAATRHPGQVRVLALDSDADALADLRRGAELSAVAPMVEAVHATLGARAVTGRTDAPPVVTLDGLLQNRPVRPDRVFLRLDSGGREPEIVAGGIELLADRRIAAIVWRRGAAYDEGAGATRLAQLLDDLGALGFRHFRLPDDNLGGPLMPYAPLAEPATVFSLPRGFQRMRDYANPRPQARASGDAGCYAGLDPAARRVRTAVLKLAGASDAARWCDPANLTEGATARAALAGPHLAAKAGGPAIRVLDLGAGAMRLKDHLPPGANYMPADLVPRSPDTAIVDLNQGDFPPGVFDVAALLETLEFVHDAQALLARARTAAQRLVLTYRVATGGDTEARAAEGWFNAFTRSEIESQLAMAGWVVATHRREGAFDLFVCDAADPRA